MLAIYSLVDLVSIYIILLLYSIDFLLANIIKISLLLI